MCLFKKFKGANAEPQQQEAATTPSTEDLSSLSFLDLIGKMTEYANTMKTQFSPTTVANFENAVARYEELVPTLTGMIAISAVGYVNAYKQYVTNLKMLLQMGPNAKPQVDMTINQILAMNNGLIFMANK